MKILKLTEEERKERKGERRRRYYTKNKDKECERSRQWHLNNKDRAKENARLYHLNNKEKINARRGRRRTKAKNTALSPQILQERLLNERIAVLKAKPIEELIYVRLYYVERASKTQHK